MDLLIKNMEMPKRCKDCFALGILECQSKNRVIEVNMTGQNRPYDCPLVEVPPHGRLIDADALLPKSGYDPMMFKHKYDGDHRTQYDTLMGYEILGIVEDAPTVLEAST